MEKPVMIALDFKNQGELKHFLDQFPAHVKLTLKIGMELFYGLGPDIVRDIHEKGHDIFLDLKLNDIPNTVEKAMVQLGRMGVQYTTIHALGGSEMIRAAKRGLTAGAKEAGYQTPKLLAVTELTSISETQLHEEQNVGLSMSEQVLKLAELTSQFGGDGVICSPNEVEYLKAKLPEDFLFVTPGIRPAGAEKGDQKRTMTPAEAAVAGSSAIVVGRPITLAEDPVVAYQTILSDFLSK
ncbi:orotidine-5'-phosphate decarboxylase [Pediococcus stilesii]|nr:orotidine-5'-phosphate decarboxylase [Pediococcus stilesii]